MMPRFGRLRMDLWRVMSPRLLARTAVFFFGSSCASQTAWTGTGFKNSPQVVEVVAKRHAAGGARIDVP